MVVNAPETPVQAEVIFAVESTAVNGAYIQELKTNYIIPTLEYFHGGALEEGAGSGSIYALVTYSTVDAYPALPVASQGPFSSPQEVLDAIDKIEFIGGQGESRACIAEALSTVLTCFDDFGRTDLPMHVLLLCCSPPFAAYGGGLVPTGGPTTVEQVARALGERGVQLSIASARRLPALLPLYDAASDLQPALNYSAKDPRHLVLLRGYSLKERPPSPAPPPVPDIQTDVYNQGRQKALVNSLTPRLPAPPPRPAWRQPLYQNNSAQGRQTALVNSLAPRLPAPPPRAPPPRPAWRQPLYQNNSALLTQLTQPSYPPPHPGQGSIQRMPGMVTPSTSTGTPPRNFIWSGVLEWMEKAKTPGDQSKVTKHLPCQVSANTKDIEPELKVDTWPNKLLMQLMPKQLISNIGGQYLKDSKSVLFHIHQNEALDALTKVMVNGFAGCVHFSPMQSPPQCDIKVLILLYTPDKKAYLGFIPNNQATFVDRLRKVIQQQKTLNKQLPPASGAGPISNPSMTGQPGMPQPGMSQPGMAQPGMSQPGMSQPGMTQPGMSQSGMPQPGMSQPGMSQPGMSQPGMSQPGMSQGGMNQATMQQSNMSPAMMAGGQGNMMQNQPNLMMQPNMPQQSVGGKGPRNVNQLDGLEAARQHNLEKIQHLQQTLEAAHQQEAQFKSQMDIMGHLQAAQQQEQHYKQLEEQRKHQQLQQQLMRGSLPPPHPNAHSALSAHSAHPGHAAHPARAMRPIMPANPGLKHLLQQQPQYRPGGPRPASQPQQFDDGSNFGEFLV